MTVPFMKGWKAHAYSNVPAASKVTDTDAPGSIVPVLKPPAEVAVCCWASLFVHVTVPPTATRTSGATNEKSLISTLTSVAAAMPSAGGSVAGVDAGADDSVIAVIACAVVDVDELAADRARRELAGVDVDVVVRRIGEDVGHDARRLAGLADERELVLLALGQAVGGVALERERERGDDRPIRSLGTAMDVGHSDFTRLEARVDPGRRDDVAQRGRVAVDPEHVGRAGPVGITHADRSIVADLGCTGQRRRQHRVLVPGSNHLRNERECSDRTTDDQDPDAGT